MLDTAISFQGLSYSLSNRRLQKCLYLSKPIVLEQPTCIGNLQRVSSFYSLPFSKKEILVEDWIKHWGAVAFGNAYLQKESLSMSLAIKTERQVPLQLLTDLIHFLLYWSSPAYRCTYEAFHVSLYWILLSKYPLLYRTIGLTVLENLYQKSRQK